jgi:hypothetical protein
MAIDGDYLVDGYMEGNNIGNQPSYPCAGNMIELKTGSHQIVNNHFWAQTTGSNLYFRNPSKVIIADNWFEGAIASDNSCIQMYNANDEASYDIQILGNLFFDSSDLYAGIRLSAAGTGSYTNVVIADNIIRGAVTQRGLQLTGTYNHVNIHDNVFLGDMLLSGDYTDFHMKNNYIDEAPTWGGANTGIYVSGNSGYVTENRGASTGTGAQQTIAHGLSATPTYVWFSDKESGANAYQSAAADATNIYVTATVNQDYVWKAEYEVT